MITITSSLGGSTNPGVALPYSWTRTSGSARHDIIGLTYPDFTLRAAGSRHGQLALIYRDRVTSQADAIAAETLHAAAAVLTYTDTDTGLHMQYVVDGDLQLELDEQTQYVWQLTVPFTQVGT